MKRCNECEENFETTDLYCHICGTELILIPNPVMTVGTDGGNNDQRRRTVDEEANERMLQTMFDIFGIDFREYFNAPPSVQLSEEYLTNLGKIEVDPKGTIFYNCLLTIGPLKLNGISSNFSELPFNNLSNLQLIEGNPICGETDLLNPPSENSILYFRRGLVSFAMKALRGQSFGAQAILISQNSDRWPFLMTDSTQATRSSSFTSLPSEEETSIIIPVIMISQNDGQILEKYLSTINSSSSSSSSSVETDSLPTTISICCQPLSKECIICQENYQPGEMILKLPCCHLYHETCLFRWLSTAHTCPLCRLQLPTEQRSQQHSLRGEGEGANLTEEQQREEDVRRHRGNYFV
jgi:hypothetical protein